MKWLVVAAVAAPGVAGCAGPEVSGWQPESDYSYTLRSSCGERLVHGTLRLTVADGKVAKAVGLDEAGSATVEVAKLEHLPTLADLVEEYNAAVRAGAHRAEAEFDESGRPERIDLDGNAFAIDDEACYVISDYVVNE